MHPVLIALSIVTAFCVVAVPLYAVWTLGLTRFCRCGLNDPNCAECYKELGVGD